MNTLAKVRMCGSRLHDALHKVLSVTTINLPVSIEECREHVAGGIKADANVNASSPYVILRRLT